MTSIIKRNTLVLLGVVTIIIIIIAASLPQLELKPGMPLPRLENGQVVAAPVEKQAPVAVSVNKFVVMFFLLILAGLMLYIIYELLKGTDWKTLISYILSILFVSLLVMVFIFIILRLPSNSVPMDLPPPLPTSALPASAPLGPVPPILIWFVGLGLLIITILVGIWIFSSSFKQKTTLDIVGLEAERARQALKDGLDLKDVVVQCYQRMSLVLQKEQGIERKDFMTTGEFEGLLEAAGVPHDPVHQLTRLFEAVRYGNWQPNPEDDQKAIQSLEAIVSFSREAEKAD